MKIIFIVFILAGLQRDSNWLNKQQTLIQSIDENAVLKKTENKNGVVLQRFVYGNYVKDESQFKGDHSLIMGGTITTYLEKKHILCQKRFLTTQYLKKKIGDQIFK